MFYQAKNGTIPMDGTELDYVVFGSGKKNLVMFPGLGEGLTSVKGTAIPVAFMYRLFAKEFRVYMFGRKRTLPEVYSTKEMAEDIYKALNILGVEKTSVVGVSMGGMVAQHLAAEHPEVMEKLALVVTSARNNETLNDSITLWMEQAKAGDYKALMLDNAKRMYSDAYLKKNLWMFHLMGNVGKPRSFARFLTMAQACLDHNAYDSLEKNTAPTLVIGGALDRCLTGAASEEIAAKIPNAKLVMYPDYGHALYEEAKDFNPLLFDFFAKP